MTMSNELLDACATGGGSLFFIGLLLLAVLGLGVAALVKVLFGSAPGSDPHAERLAPRVSDVRGDITWSAWQW